MRAYMLVYRLVHSDMRNAPCCSADTTGACASGWFTRRERLTFTGCAASRLCNMGGVVGGLRGCAASTDEAHTSSTWYLTAVPEAPDVDFSEHVKHVEDVSVVREEILA